ncbi:unnamed protein product, partial [Amoebophrya sp. A25]
SALPAHTFVFLIKRKDGRGGSCSDERVHDEPCSSCAANECPLAHGAT